MHPFFRPDNDYNFNEPDRRWGVANFVHDSYANFVSLVNDKVVSEFQQKYNTKKHPKYMLLWKGAPIHD